MAILCTFTLYYIQLQFSDKTEVDEDEHNPEIAKRRVEPNKKANLNCFHFPI